MDLNIQLDFDDFQDIERDLSLPEKASVLFLLCRDDLEVDFFLQQLALLTSMPNNTSHCTTIILDWSRRRKGEMDCSSNILVEALTVAQCNHVLMKLGLNLEKLTLFHFPTRPEITTCIHPIIKLLYLMCEKLNIDSSRQLLAKMKDRFASQLSTLDINEPSMLEVHLLHWTSQKILRIFQDRVSIGPLVECLKEIDNLDLYDFLKSNVDRCSNAASSVVQDRETSAISQGLQLNATATEDGESYVTNKISPGVLLIINQFKFHTECDPNLSFLLPTKPLDNRKGTEKDVEALQRTFSRFNFQIILREDLSHTEILEAIRTTIGSMKRSDSCLFVAVLSHGIEGCVYGSNSIPLDVREIKNQIYNSDILGRPKVLIVQACQGSDLQISKIVDNNLQTDAPSTSRPVAIPPCSDFLIAWSTVEGFASLRHVLKGTWFVQTLCEMIDEHHATTHLVDILTMVNNRIASMKGNRNESMIPKIESTFRKKFYFQ